MKNIFKTMGLAVIGLAAISCGGNSTQPVPERDYVILVHGGAGNLTAVANDPVRSAQYKAALDSALQIGREMMETTGKGTDVVRAVIRYFEGNALFNAGVGATITAEGTFELDASIMEGKDLSAGAVAGVRYIKNPIEAAYAVKERTEHVMLAGSGAEEFARQDGLEMVEDNMYFSCPKTLKWIEQLKEASKKNGTVGCVVLDRKGNLVAGTSTGGRKNKKWGRIGDSPVIGAGTYADNDGAAVSCTGHGEYYIRHAVASSLSNRVKLLGQSLEEAAIQIIHNELTSEAGNGGLIAVDRQGNFTMQFNSTGMYRGFIYKDKNSDTPVQGIGICEDLLD